MTPKRALTVVPDAPATPFGAVGWEQPAFGQQDAEASSKASLARATGPSDLGDEDPVVKLTKFKQLLDAGLITPADYDAAKAKVLGL